MEIRVNFIEMNNKMRPKDHMQILSAVLPEKYSPLQPSGNGNQGIYLTELSLELSQTLIGIIGRQAQELAATAVAPGISRPAAETSDMEIWEHHL